MQPLQQPPIGQASPQENILPLEKKVGNLDERQITYPSQIPSELTNEEDIIDAIMDRVRCDFNDIVCVYEWLPKSNEGGLTTEGRADINKLIAEVSSETLNNPWVTQNEKALGQIQEFVNLCTEELKCVIEIEEMMRKKSNCG